jgi:hypothetical protein
MEDFLLQSSLPGARRHTWNLKPELREHEDFGKSHETSGEEWSLVLQNSTAACSDDFRKAISTSYR